MSSVKTNDPWLSVDFWRTGGSKLGVPALLSGLEKLNDGLGSGADMSDAIEGDLWNDALGDGEMRPPPLLVENFRNACCECIGETAADALSLSSSAVSDDMDLMLGGRGGNRFRGGARPLVSFETVCLSFSGDWENDRLRNEEA